MSCQRIVEGSTFLLPPHETASCQEPAPPPQISSLWQDAQVVIIRVLLVTVLLAAAGLKSETISGEMARDAGVTWESTAGLALITWEYVLSLWLITGYRLHRAFLVLQATFVLFGTYAFWLVLTRAESCGCWGRVQVTPLAAMLFDAFVVVSLSMVIRHRPLLCRRHIQRDLQVALLRRTGKPRRSVAMFQVGAVCLWTIALTCSGWLFSSAVRAVEKSPGVMKLGHGIVVLQPSRWVGHRLPMRDHLSPDGTFDQGTWELLFIRTSCPKCRELMDELSQQGQLPRNLRIIDLDQQEPLTNWLMPLPTRVLLRDGVVTEAMSTDSTSLTDVEYGNMS